MKKRKGFLLDDSDVLPPPPLTDEDKKKIREEAERLKKAGRLPGLDPDLEVEP